jgi:hypothetical protein
MCDFWYKIREFVLKLRAKEANRLLSLMCNTLVNGNLYEKEMNYKYWEGETKLKVFMILW